MKDIPKVEMKKIDLAYVAGLFDGEGCIHIGRHKARAGRHSAQLNFQLQVSVIMCRSAPIKFMQQLFGGGVLDYSYNSRPHYYRWVRYNRKADIILSAIEPYIKLKGPQIKLAHQFVALLREKGGSPKGHNGQIALSPQEIEARLNLYRRMRELNGAREGRNNLA